MKVSVVIPTYNEEAYIATCLDALMKQLVKPDEIIIVNNNSTDRTVEIAKKYPVRIVNEEQQGMIQARNKGFDEAKYEIIARTDADTILPPDWIKKIKNNFLNKNIVGLSGGGTVYDAPNDLSKQAIEQSVKPYLRLMRSALGHNCFIGSNMAIRKSAWKKAKNLVCLNNKDVHEDIDLSIHLAPFGKIKIDPALKVSTSLRRLRKLDGYFEYPYRVIKSIRKHKKFVMEEKSKKFVKNIVKQISLTNQLLN